MTGKFKSQVVRYGSFLVMIFVSILLVWIMMDKVKADDDESDFSFYRLSSAAAMYYDDANNGVSKSFEAKVFDLDKNVSPGNGGGLVGFLDESHGDGFFGATVSYLSASAQSHSYISYKNVAKGIYHYAVFGHALSVLGYDTTVSDGFDISWIGRWVAGAIMILAFMIVMAVSFIFNAVILVLKFLNPFTWFAQVAADVNAYMSLAMGGAANPFNGVAVIMAKFYTSLYNLSWSFTIPFMLMWLMLLWILGKMSKSFANSVGDIGIRVRRFMVRVFFLVVGMPMLAMLYTSTLDSLLAEPSFSQIQTQDGVVISEQGLGNPIAGRAIGAVSEIFLDFETWASISQLRLPHGYSLEIDVSTVHEGVLSDNQLSKANTREMASAINKESWALKKQKTFSKDRSPNITWADAMDMLQRYAGSAKYTASAYEAEIKDDMKRLNFEKELFEGIKYLSEFKNYHSKGLFASPTKVDGLDPSIVQTLLLNGNMVVREVDGGEKLVFDGHGGNSLGSISNSIKRIGDAIGGSAQQIGNQISNWIDKLGQNSKAIPIPGGLSSLAMYNYLNTSFDDTNFTVYSSYKAQSGYTRRTHRSVNLIGGGIVGMLYYINTFATFIACIVIGIYYSIAMLINTVRRGFRVMTAVPMATLGSLKYMSIMSAYTFMMIMEILGTVFMFYLVMEFLFSMTDVLVVPLQKLGQQSKSFDAVTSTILFDGQGVPASVGGFLMSLVMLIISIVMTFWFMGMALKMRKSVIKGLDDFFAKQSDTFFMVLDKNGGGPGQTAVNNALAPSPALQAAGDIAKSTLAGGAGGAALNALSHVTGDKKGASAQETDGGSSGNDDEYDVKTGPIHSDPGGGGSGGGSNEAVEGSNRQQLTGSSVPVVQNTSRAMLPGEVSDTPDEPKGPENPSGSGGEKKALPTSKDEESSDDGWKALLTHMKEAREQDRQEARAKEYAKPLSAEEAMAQKKQGEGLVAQGLLQSKMAKVRGDEDMAKDAVQKIATGQQMMRDARENKKYDPSNPKQDLANMDHSMIFPTLRGKKGTKGLMDEGTNTGEPGSKGVKSSDGGGGTQSVSGKVDANLRISKDETHRLLEKIDLNAIMSSAANLSKQGTSHGVRGVKTGGSGGAMGQVMNHINMNMSSAGSHVNVSMNNTNSMYANENNIKMTQADKNMQMMHMRAKEMSSMGNSLNAKAQGDMNRLLQTQKQINGLKGSLSNSDLMNLVARQQGAIKQANANRNLIGNFGKKFDKKDKKISKDSDNNIV